MKRKLNDSGKALDKYFFCGLLLPLSSTLFFFASPFIVVFSVVFFYLCFFYSCNFFVFLKFSFVFFVLSFLLFSFFNIHVGTF